MAVPVKPRKPTFGANAPVPTSTLSQTADLADFAANPPAAIVARVATQSLTTGLAALITWDTTIFDPGAMLAGGTNLLPGPGLYQISGWVTMAANATGIRVLELTQNGAIVLSTAGSAPSAGEARLSLSSLFLCVNGDAFALQAFQSSGSNLNITAARFTVARSSGS